MLRWRLTVWIPSFPSKLAISGSMGLTSPPYSPSTTNRIFITPLLLRESCSCRVHYPRPQGFPTGASDQGVPGFPTPQLWGSLLPSTIRLGVRDED